MKFEFLDSFKTGHVRIDEDHASIVGAINTLWAAVEEDIDHVGLKSLLGDFVDMCGAHFRHEERVLVEAGYPHIDEHVDYHSQVLEMARIAERRCVEAHTLSARLQQLEYIVGFMIDDIVRSDLKFVSFLQSRDLIR